MCHIVFNNWALYILVCYAIDGEVSSVTFHIVQLSLLFLYKIQIIRFFYRVQMNKFCKSD